MKSWAWEANMTNTDERDDDWKQTWDAREAALKSVLGEADGMVLHAMIPFYLGGQADVICFRKHVPGRVAATCELLGEEGQIKNDLGTYELMIAHRDDNDWGPNIISRLARYTCDAQLDPGHTMEIRPEVPEGSTIAGFLFCDYARFSYGGQDAGLLLCLGITADELEHCIAGRRDEVLAALKAAGVFPYTDLFRESTMRSHGSGA
jgi:hypothetical protein